jgi:hypothetical protein
MSKLLVVGSYPPVPGPAAAATMTAVRRGWEHGQEVEVVSPRPSAAHRSTRLVGLRAAWELHRLRHTEQADELALCMETGMPFAARANRWRLGAQAIALAWALRGYRRVTLMTTSDFHVPGRSLAPLWRQVHEVVITSEAERGLLATRLGVPARLIRVDASQSSTEVASPLPGEVVTPSGPREWAWAEQPRRLASLLTRRILGRHADAVRARVVPRLRELRQRLTTETRSGADPGG